MLLSAVPADRISLQARGSVLDLCRLDSIQAAVRRGGSLSRVNSTAPRAASIPGGALSLGRQVTAAPDGIIQFPAASHQMKRVISNTLTFSRQNSQDGKPSPFVLVPPSVPPAAAPEGVLSLTRKSSSLGSDFFRNISIGPLESFLSVPGNTINILSNEKSPSSEEADIREEIHQMVIQGGSSAVKAIKAKLDSYPDEGMQLSRAVLDTEIEHRTGTETVTEHLRSQNQCDYLNSILLQSNSLTLLFQLPPTALPNSHTVRIY